MFQWATKQAVVVAEWLRRWTRNPLGSARAGSNPADYGFFLPFHQLIMTKKSILDSKRKGHKILAFLIFSVQITISISVLCKICKC